MRRITKKDINLNRLKTGCSPCMNEAKIMKQKIAFFIDTSQTSGVAFSEVVYMLIK